MDESSFEKANTEIVSKNLPIMVSELMRWPHSQICIISNEFDDRMVNPNEFEGYCNGFLHEDEENQILEAVRECGDPVDLARPLVISAKISAEVSDSSVLSFYCGATGAWGYECAIKLEEGQVKSVLIFTRDDHGMPILRNDKGVVTLMTVVKNILGNRIRNSSKIEFLIK